MFEGIVCGFFVFAVGYVALLRVMARRADVLHGEFIQPDGMGASHAPLSAWAMIQRYVQGVARPARR